MMKYRVMLVWLVLLFGCGQANATSTPAASTDSTFAVALERAACFRTCPIYTVQVDSTGAVTFDGRDFVAQTGIHTGTLNREQLAQLETLVDESKIFEMEDEYIGAVTDLPSIIVTVTRNGVTKSVRHYGIGCLDSTSANMSGGAPATLCRLQTGIDEITNTDQWIK